MRGKLLVVAALALAGCGVLVGASDEDPTPTNVTTADASSDGAVDGSSSPTPSDAGAIPDAEGDAGCGDTKTDPNNCGACGRKCNAGGGCDAGVCDRHVVFATSQKFQGGSFAGTGADATCTAIANTAGLSGTFRVWLTHPTQPNRFATTIALPYYTTRGSIVSNKWPPGPDLTSPIDADEKGGDASQSFAWSNLTGSGTLVGGTDNCLGWGSNAANQQGTFGQTSALGFGWTQGVDGNNNDSTVVLCSQSLRLYCVEWP